MSSTARRTTATLAATALIGAPLALLATPAEAGAAQHLRFPLAEAQVDFSVERDDDGRYEVDVDIDEALQGSRWRITLKHDGKRFLRTVRTADDDGDVEINRMRANTSGADNFAVIVKKIAGPKKAGSIKMR